MNGSTNLTTEDLYEEIFTSYQEGTNRTSIETATKLINADELLHNDLIYNYSQLTPSQERAVAYTPKVTAVLSLLGSAWIVYDLCLRDTKHLKLKTTYHRLILSMSLIDILSSSWLFIGTWAVPIHYSFNAYGNAGYKVAGASGNEASCEAQGTVPERNRNNSMHCCSDYHEWRNTYSYLLPALLFISSLFFDSLHYTQLLSMHTFQIQ